MPDVIMEKNSLLNLDRSLPLLTEEDMARMRVAALNARADLSPHQRRKIVEGYLQPILQRHKELDDEQRALDAKLAGLHGKIAAGRDFVTWAERGGFVLESPEGSRLHQVAEALLAGRLHLGHKDEEVGQWTALFERLVPAAQSFVICHDWAAAFAGAAEFDGGDAPLPADVCCFEFKISGRIGMFFVEKDSECIGVIWSVLGDKWMGAFFQQPAAGGSLDNDAYDLALREIRAVLIALDAEVAIKEVVRSPHKMNQAREKIGKPPLRDYHVISLAPHHRAAGQAGTGSHRSPRLHFRRGHWRHYESHKTWIRWTLAGNPALGFVDKEYRL